MSATIWRKLQKQGFPVWFLCNSCHIHQIFNCFCMWYLMAGSFSKCHCASMECDSIFQSSQRYSSQVGVLWPFSLSEWWFNHPVRYEFSSSMILFYYLNEPLWHYLCPTFKGHLMQTLVLRFKHPLRESMEFKQVLVSWVVENVDPFCLEILAKRDFRWYIQTLLDNIL